MMFIISKLSMKKHCRSSREVAVSQNSVACANLESLDVELRITTNAALSLHI
jgi:hypothetical protein